MSMKRMTVKACFLSSGHGSELYFEDMKSFFEWLYEKEHITREGFFMSSSFRANEDNSLMQFTTWGLALHLHRGEWLIDEKVDA